MNVLALIIAIILVVFALIGAKQGFVKMLFSLIKMIAILFLGILFTGTIADLLMEHTHVYESVLKHVAGSEAVAGFVVKGIAFVIAIIIIANVFFIIQKIIEALASLPVIKTVNHVMGFLFGIIEGLLVSWIILYLIKVFGNLGDGKLISMIDSSPFLSFLSENNLVQTFIEML